MPYPQDFSIIPPPESKYKELDWMQIFNEPIEDNPPGPPPFTLGKVSPQVTPPPAAAGPETPATLPDTMAQYANIIKELIPAPVYDKNREKSLRNTALFQAIGNALTNVVNTATVGSGTPIIRTDNKYVFNSIGELNKLRDRHDLYMQDYNRNLTHGGLQALQMARGDVQAQEQRAYNSAEAEKQRTWTTQNQDTSRDKEFEMRKDLIEIETANRKDLNAEQFKQQKELEEKRHGLTMAEIDKRITGEQQNQFIKSAFEAQKEMNKDSFEVIDNVSGKTVSMPPAIYWDVASKVVAAMTPEELQSWMTVTDYNASNNAIKIMIANKWPEYFQVDAQGNWSRKGQQAATNPLQPPASTPAQSTAPAQGTMWPGTDTSNAAAPATTGSLWEDEEDKKKK